MARTTTKLTALALLASMGAAHAGGFSRGAADTDILFEEGNFNLRTGVTFVNPSRKYTANVNPALIGTNYTDSYAIFSGAVKLNITDDLRCTTTFAEPYGGSTSYAVPTGSGKLKENFSILEYGLTCGYKFDLSKGRAWLIGGIYVEDFDYSRTNFRTATTRFQLNLEGQDTGFRVGAAYEIPEIALRAQLMYRAASSYGAEGTLGVISIGPPGVGPVAGFDAFGTGELPQSVEFKLQSGIAPGWLAFGSVKWTDWSVTEQLIVNVPAFGAAGTSTNDYFWRDGWTITGGIGHAFNEQLSGAVSLTWDRGVGTGWDLSSDTWTLGVGGSFKDSLGGELRIGVGLSYLSSAESTLFTPATPPALAGPEAVDSSWAWALSASYKAKW
jgi:long-chain fatty acid transport protein